MINAFVIVVAVVLLGFMILGAVKGFVHTVFTMFSLLVIIVITGLLSPYVSDYIVNHTGIPQKVNRKIEESIDLKGKVSSTGGNIDEFIDKIDAPDQLKSVLKEKSRKAGDNISAQTAEAVGQMQQNVYSRITDLIVDAIAYVFTFAVVGVIVIVAGLLMDILAKLPGIKQANTILGAIFGLLQGYLVASVMYIMAVAFAATEIGSEIVRMVDESSILTWFYEHNIIVDIILNLLK